MVLLMSPPRGRFRSSRWPSLSTAHRTASWSMPSLRERSVPSELAPRLQDAAYREMITAQRVAYEISRRYAPAPLALWVDVSRLDSTLILVQQVVDAFQRLDILVNNAGVAHFGVDFETSLRTNGGGRSLPTSMAYSSVHRPSCRR
jgi:NAD(P)-dependent dehydrogenase (short-subunit alcohol dehydrogenase family)